MPHTCHATNCEVKVPPEMFMCKKHWFKLSRILRSRIWATYRVGQCDDKSPSNEYCIAARECVISIARKEGIEPDTRLYDFYIRR